MKFSTDKLQKSKPTWKDVVLKWAIKPEQRIFDIEARTQYIKTEGTNKPPKTIENLSTLTYRKPGDLAYFREKLLSPSRIK